MFDFLFRNGTVIDGTGARRAAADVAIRGERIAAVERLPSADAREVVDVSGLVVAPGFIDVHNHSDSWMAVLPHLTAKTKQGFTTEILMADGISYAPVVPRTVRQWIFYLRSLNGLRFDQYRGWQTWAEYMQGIDGNNAQNAAAHVPYANVRALACGFGDCAVDDFQMRRIQYEIQLALDEGAVGLSTGLDYISQCFSTTEELVAACEPLRGGSRPYVTHMRYKRGILTALAEAVEIGRRAEVPVHVSHLKVLPPHNAEEILGFIDQAQRDVVVTFDVYPYQPGSTMLNYLLPYEVWRDGPLAALNRLEDPDVRERFAASLKSFRLKLDRLRIAWLPGRDNAHWIGRSLSEYVAASDRPAAEALCDLLFEERLAVLLVYDEGDDRLVEPFLRHPRYMMGTDGIYFPEGHVHPRMYGSTGRLLGPCVREQRLFSLEEAVHRLSGFPARTFGLAERGQLRAGYFADLVVFDPERIVDHATYDSPAQDTEGVQHVLVNGVPVIRDGQPVQFSGKLPGRFVRSADG